MRLGLVALVLAAGACWGAGARAPHADDRIPGLVWWTPPQPWHTTFSPLQIVVDGDAMLVVGYSRIGRFDLMTGEMAQEAALPDLLVGSVVALGHGRWLVTGTHDEKTVAFVVDLATLATTPVALPSKTEKGYLRGEAVRLPDGDVVICGEGLPLAAYDPVTWKVRRVLDEEHAWSELRTDGVALYGRLDFAWQQIDLATGTKTPLDRVVVRAAGNGTRVEDAQVVVPDHEPVAFKRLGDVVLLDRDATRIAETAHGIVRVTQLPAMTAATFDLSPLRWTVIPKLAFAGDRVIAVVDTRVQVIDLRAREVRPSFAAPYGAASRLQVADDGALTIYGAQLWRVTKGKTTTLGPLPEEAILQGPPGVSATFATATRSEPPQIKLFHPGDATPSETRALPQRFLGGWTGANGQIAVEALASIDEPAHLLLSRGGEFEVVTPIAEDATIDDVDVDADTALVAMKGAIWPIRLSDPALPPVPLRIPTCGEYGTAGLERGGTRVVTFDAKKVALWDRTTSDLLGALQLPADVYDVLFIPHRDDVLVHLEHAVVVWSPKQHIVRTLDRIQAAMLAVSPDGHLLGIAHAQARYALVDLDALIAALPSTRAEPTQVPVTCPHGDPLTIVPPTELEPDGDD